MSSTSSRSLRPRKSKETTKDSGLSYAKETKIDEVLSEQSVLSDQLVENDKSVNQRTTAKSKQRKSPKPKSKTSATKKRKSKPAKSSPPKKQKRDVLDPKSCHFVGEPIPMAEAQSRWPNRYKVKAGDSTSGSKKHDDADEEVVFAECHFQQATIDGIMYDLGDDVYVGAEGEDEDYIGKIVQFFKSIDGRALFTAQWFFRAKDTLIKEQHASLVDERRLFYSDYKNDNLLDCIISKIAIVKVSPKVGGAAKNDPIPSSTFFYDMQYSWNCSTFSNLPTETLGVSNEISSARSSGAASDRPVNGKMSSFKKASLNNTSEESKMTLLDLYSGCGAMSTGLCLGAATSGVELVTRWAVDFNKDACKSLKENHPNAEVRNECAEDFLSLLKEWRKLCEEFSLLDAKKKRKTSLLMINDVTEAEDDHQTSSGELEVEMLVGISYGRPEMEKKTEVYFKVRWLGYGEEDDTWEPRSGLLNCEASIKEFVRKGYEANILPLPGDVDVVCGGPPCQGISGFNRYRNKKDPLKDPKNFQLVVFMDIVDYLKPRFVLMENVVDILRFSDGYLIRYATGRLVSSDYQSRIGIMVAGCYGLPQFRMRVFLWGARPTENLPSFPLPTHEAVKRGGVPKEFARNLVAYDEGHEIKLEKALDLGDAISDLPQVTNYASLDSIPYGKPALTKFQKYIRSSKEEMIGSKADPKRKSMLYDHRPFKLNEDDYLRVCQVPKRKGANFRDLPGVLVGPRNKVMLDESVERVKLPSGKFLIPDYAISSNNGRSNKTFGRLWWDSNISTVLTRPEPHSQKIIHPDQDRVLSVREIARLQGFPDYYRLFGAIRERYKQVGNAVAIPVGRVLGYSLGLACRGIHVDQPVFTLPPEFSIFGA